MARTRDEVLQELKAARGRATAAKQEVQRLEQELQGLNAVPESPLPPSRSYGGSGAGGSIKQLTAPKTE